MKKTAVSVPATEPAVAAPFDVDKTWEAIETAFIRLESMLRVTKAALNGISLEGGHDRRIDDIGDVLSSCVGGLVDLQTQVGHTVTALEKVIPVSDSSTSGGAR